jgi:galacturonosyltransferase
MMQNTQEIFYISNTPLKKNSFRRELIETLLQNNHRIYMLVPEGSDELYFKNKGSLFYTIRVDRRGKNIFSDFHLFLQYHSFLRRIRPSLCLSYTVKPNIYAGIACRLLRVPHIANITGLGIAVENPGFLKTLVLFLTKVALKKTNTVFFQNESNKKFFEQLSIIRFDQAKLIPGSGVNLSKNFHLNYPEDAGTIRLIFIGRIMKDKGIEELMDAIIKVRAKYPLVSCDIVGSFEDNTYKSAVESFVSSGSGNYLGRSSDVHALLSEYHAVLLPSYHEGMSNVLLEAAATGRPVLASNVPGCRETFDEGISGFGFEPRSVDSLVEAIERFIDLPHEQKAEMGLAGRKKMGREFDRQIVVDAYMREIENILEENEKKDKKK